MNCGKILLLMCMASDQIMFELLLISVCFTHCLCNISACFQVYFKLTFRMYSIRFHKKDDLWHLTAGAGNFPLVYKGSLLRKKT